jgi:hypothetical protein
MGDCGSGLGHTFSFIKSDEICRVTNQLIILERGNAYGYIYFLSCIYE